jgi:hypothetical protein
MKEADDIDETLDDGNGIWWDNLLACIACMA